MIQLFTTGGTIEGIDYVNDIGIADSNITIKDFLTNANIGFDYTIENVFKKDSRSIRDEDRELLVRKIKETNAVLSLWKIPQNISENLT